MAWHSVLRAGGTAARGRADADVAGAAFASGRDDFQQSAVFTWHGHEGDDRGARRPLRRRGTVCDRGTGDQGHGIAGPVRDCGALCGMDFAGAYGCASCLYSCKP